MNFQVKICSQMCSGTKTNDQIFGTPLSNQDCKSGGPGKWDPKKRGTKAKVGYQKVGYQKKIPKK